MTELISPPIYELGPDFYDEVEAAPFPQARLRYRNQTASKIIGLDHLSNEEWQQHFAHFKALPGNIAKPLALRYHGHQFRVYNPQLGDGRGFLFAQFLADNKLYDLGTKGSGKTPYSRGGDGRLTLKGAFREILATELLESYGVNTSKTFSVFETGESLERHDEPSPTRAGVLVRLSHSHIRIGTFQRLAALGQNENIKKLLNYCVKHYYPTLSFLDGAELASSFLREVSYAIAKTTAQWMIGGFVHGVLNTDNINITGESFDYGPYRFLPKYDPTFTAAYFDQSGLYCFGRQPTAVLWNLFQLGAALKSAHPTLPVEELLEDFGDQFNMQVRVQLLNRLNLKPKNAASASTPAGAPALPASAEAAIDSLVINFFKFLDEAQPFYEQTFFDLHSGINEARLERSVQSALYKHPSFQDLKEALQQFEVADTAKAQHPYFAGSMACSLLIDELEAIWLHITENDNWAPFEKKLSEIRSLRGLY